MHYPPLTFWVKWGKRKENEEYFCDGVLIKHPKFDGSKLSLLQIANTNQRSILQYQLEEPLSWPETKFTALTTILLIYSTVPWPHCSHSSRKHDQLFFAFEFSDIILPNYQQFLSNRRHTDCTKTCPKPPGLWILHWFLMILLIYLWNLSTDLWMHGLGGETPL